MGIEHQDISQLSNAEAVELVARVVEIDSGNVVGWLLVVATGDMTPEGLLIGRKSACSAPFLGVAESIMRATADIKPEHFL